MPLHALCEGEDFLAWKFSTDEWISVKALSRTRRLLLPCCGSQAIPKTSKLGTQFFAHKARTTACGLSESPEHLLYKTIVARAAEQAGWHTRTEVAASDGSWRADVLCRRGKVQIALEIQLSTIPLSEFEARQQRYKAAEIRAAWFARSPFDAVELGADLPIFTLELANRLEPAISLITEANPIPLATFVVDLLSGKLEFRAPPPCPAEAFFVVPARCYNCQSTFEKIAGLFRADNRPSHKWSVESGDILSLDEVEPRRRKELRKIAATWKKHQPSLSHLAVKFSYTQRKYSFMANCPACRAKQGNFYAFELAYDGRKVMLYPLDGECQVGFSTALELPFCAAS